MLHVIDVWKGAGPDPTRYTRAMPVPAWLLGDPTRAPFVGHARVRLDTGRARLSGAGRLGVAGGLVGAFRAARRLEAVVLEAAAGPGDRHALLWRSWEALIALPAEELGADGGADLTLLLVAEDVGGIGVAGVGLSGVFGLAGGRLVPLVEGRHPLLAPPGRPARTPGVLTLELEPEAVVGVPAHLEGLAPVPEGLALRCGVRA